MPVAFLLLFSTVAVEATVIFYVGDTQKRGQSVSGEEKKKPE